MADRRIKLSPKMRDEILVAWHDLAVAHRQARSRVAAVLNEYHIAPETPGRLAVEANGALVFVVSENGQAVPQVDGASNA